MRGKGCKVFRNIYKGHMDKTRGAWNQGREVEIAGWGTGRGERQKTVLEQQ